MRLFEIESPGTTVCVFKGMSHGTAGNLACDQIAQATGGKSWGPLDSSSAASAAVAKAAEYFRSRPGTRLVVVGYSKGAESVLGMQALKPALTITIAGYYSTLEQLAGASQGTWHNFYQQTELDRYKKSTYKPGGIAHAVDYGHSAIVPGVSSQVISLIQSVGSGSPTRPNKEPAHWGDKYKESQGRGKNFN
jgi:hypothetical protein